MKEKLLTCRRYSECDDFYKVSLLSPATSQDGGENSGRIVSGSETESVKAAQANISVTLALEVDDTPSFQAQHDSDNSSWNDILRIPDGEECGTSVLVETCPEGKPLAQDMSLRQLSELEHNLEIKLYKARLKMRAHAQTIKAHSHYLDDRIFWATELFRQATTIPP